MIQPYAGGGTLRLFWKEVKVAKAELSRKREEVTLVFPVLLTTILFAFWQTIALSFHSQKIIRNIYRQHHLTLDLLKLTGYMLVSSIFVPSWIIFWNSKGRNLYLEAEIIQHFWISMHPASDGSRSFVGNHIFTILSIR